MAATARPVEVAVSMPSRKARNGIVRLVISAAEVDDLGVDTPEGDQRGRGVVQGPPVSGGDHRALRRRFWLPAGWSASFRAKAAR
jgi:hypothetical protein